MPRLGRWVTVIKEKPPRNQPKPFNPHRYLWAGGALKRTGVLAIVLGLLGAVIGLLLYYGCALGTGVACPSNDYQIVGLLMLVLGEALFLVGVVFLRAHPGRVTTSANADRRQPLPVTRDPISQRSLAVQQAREAASEPRQLFCPACGRRYKTAIGRYCPVDATELQPVAG